MVNTRHGDFIDTGAEITTISATFFLDLYSRYRVSLPLHHPAAGHGSGGVRFVPGPNTPTIPVQTPEDFFRAHIGDRETVGRFALDRGLGFQQELVAHPDASNFTYNIDLDPPITEPYHPPRQSAFRLSLTRYQQQHVHRELQRLIDSGHLIRGPRPTVEELDGSDDSSGSSPQSGSPAPTSTQ